jgi:hypothetical protein
MIGAMFSQHYATIARAMPDHEFEVITSLSGSELITNGSFGSGTGWGFGTGWSLSFSPAEARCTASTNGGILSQTLTLDTTKIHRLQFTVGVVTGSDWTLKIVCGGVDIHTISGAFPSQGSRTYYYDFIPITAFAIPNLTFTCYTGSSTTMTLDEISLQEATATKTVAVQQWYTYGLFARKGNFNAPSDAMSESSVWIG